MRELSDKLFKRRAQLGYSHNCRAGGESKLLKKKNLTVYNSREVEGV